MSNENTQQVAAYKAMQTDIQVSMDDVVSAFVSQYENNLYARKKELTAAIKEEEATIVRIEKEVRAAVTGDEWASEILPFNLSLTVKQGTIDFDGKRVHFSIIVETKENKGYYGNQVKIEKTKKIPAAYVNAHKKTVDALTALRTELSEVLVNLKSVTRKERQVRGRIAMRKLEDSGYASLMADEELIKLVQLEE
jgi:predicted transcriptional regulator